MGYSHGQRWDDEKIIQEIIKVKEFLKIDTMPTHSQMNNVTNNTMLSNAISRHGGSNRFAEILGLEIKPSESKLGEEYELLFMEHVEAMTCLKVEKMPVKHPYDVLVGDSVKVDVKVSNISKFNGGYYTFNLEKKHPTCDVFACYCLDSDNKPSKVYIIPAIALKGMTQLSVGINTSEYDKWLYRWDLLTTYATYDIAVCECS